jgi:hypothetical protein
VVASPAPLTVAKRGARGGRGKKGGAAAGAGAGAAAADENAKPGGTAGELLAALATALSVCSHSHLLMTSRSLQNNDGRSLPA